MGWHDDVKADVQETIQNLVALRKDISKKPKPSYQLHGHAISWTEYLTYLGNEIDRCRRELAQIDPVEEIGQGY